MGPNLRVGSGTTANTAYNGSAYESVARGRRVCRMRVRRTRRMRRLRHLEHTRHLEYKHRSFRLRGRALGRRESYSAA